MRSACFFGGVLTSGFFAYASFVGQRIPMVWKVEGGGGLLAVYAPPPPGESRIELSLFWVCVSPNTSLSRGRASLWPLWISAVCVFAGTQVWLFYVPYVNPFTGHPDSAIHYHVTVGVSVLLVVFHQ